jgi:nitroreductase
MAAGHGPWLLAFHGGSVIRILGQVSSMTERTSGEAVPIPAGQVDYLIATAARAPSVHNTQPWRFNVSRDTIELHADLRRKLRTDPLGREILISCGAAVFGLRLAVRSLGYLPLVELLPDPARLRLLARVRLGAAAPITARERAMLEALPHRHTHRGPFEPGPLPAGLLAGLQHDALAEGATLAIVDRVLAFEQLAAIIGAAGRRQDLDPVARAEVRRWSRSAGNPARDGVPAQAFPATAARRPGAAPAAGPRRQPVGLRQPAYAAAGSRRDPVPDPGPPGPSRDPADAAAARPRPHHASHRPPAARGPDRAVTATRVKTQDGWRAWRVRRILPG